MSNQNNLTSFETVNPTQIAGNPSGIYLLTVTSKSVSAWQWDNLLPQHPWLGNMVRMLQRKPAGKSHKGYAAFQIAPDYRAQAQAIIAEFKRLGYEAELNVMSVNTSLK